MSDASFAVIVDEQIRRLTDAAQDVAIKSYSPYSRFRVGAALLLAEPPGDLIVAGCNVENASYRLTTCAEQAAIASAVAQYGPAIRVRAIAVVNLNRAACSPCGACRQTLLEFSSPETSVFFPGPDGSYERRSLAELLPEGFALSAG